MVNRNYLNGRAREYRLMNSLKEQGFKVFRMSGSHGEFDLIALNPITHVIHFIQVKPTSLSKQAKTRLQSKISWANAIWVGHVSVISKIKELKC